MGVGGAGSGSRPIPSTAAPVAANSGVEEAEGGSELARRGRQRGPAGWGRQRATVRCRGGRPWWRRAIAAASAGDPARGREGGGMRGGEEGTRRGKEATCR